MDITINAGILVVDDSLLILTMIEEMLGDSYDVRLAQSAEIALSKLKERIPDLILLDLEMPQKDGYALLAELKSTARWRDIPVIFLTGTDDRGKEEKALSMGAVDYILKPISAGVLKRRIQMHLELRAYQRNLENLVGLRTFQLLETQNLILDILASVTTYRDNDTGAHLIRTTQYSTLIVEKLLALRHPDYLVSRKYADNIIKAVKLHDIGKIAIADNILLKTGGLTPAEFETIKMHTVYGAQMIDNAARRHKGEASFLDTAREIILHHHEWWNGNGYPSRLKGTDIPLSARIMAVADVYDALISNRPYKKPFLHTEALEIIRRETGTHFDGMLMDLIADLMPEFEEIAHTFQDE